MNNSIKHQSLIYTQLKVKTIQFSISMQFSSIWPIDRTLSGATNPGRCQPGSNGNEEVLYILQSSRTGASPTDCLVSYLGYMWRESYLSVEMQSMYSTAPADWARIMKNIKICFILFIRLRWLLYCVIRSKFLFGNVISSLSFNFCGSIQPVIIKSPSLGLYPSQPLNILQYFSFVWGTIPSSLLFPLTIIY